MRKQFLLGGCRLDRALAFGAIWLCALGATAEAEIGKGWTEYFPEKMIQRWGSGRSVPGNTQYTNVDGVETFSISGNDERCEARILDDYTSGTTQFQGEFFMVSFNGKTGDDDVCIAQVWLSMIVSFANVNGGSVRQHSGFFANNLMGKWVRLNTFHSADANRGEVWVDNVKVWSGSTKDSNPFYHKYGLYNQAKNNPVIKWRGTRFWRGGTTEGGFSSPVIRKTAQEGLSARGAARAGLSIFDLNGRLLGRPSAAGPVEGAAMKGLGSGIGILAAENGRKATLLVLEPGNVPALEETR